MNVAIFPSCGYREGKKEGVSVSELLAYRVLTFSSVTPRITSECVKIFCVEVRSHTV